MNGGTDSLFRFPDVAQHGLVAQQGDAHAFWFGALTMAQVDDAELSAIRIATISVSETAILLNIRYFLACLRLFVETAFNFGDPKTRNAQL